MAYCTRAQLELACGGAAALLELADQDGDGAEDAGVVDQCMDDGAGLIDTYASKRFAVPMSTTVQLAKVNARLARYYLKDANRGMLTEADLKAYEADLQWLSDLAEGKVLPGVEPLPAKSQIMRDSASARPDSKDVSRKKLKGFW